MRASNIRAVLPPLVLSIALLAGCGPGGDTGADDGGETKQAEQPQTDKQEEEGTGGYFGAVNKARRSATETAALSKLRQEIRRFRALKGRNPRSLDELENWRGDSLPELPAGRQYNYNPDTGELSFTGSR